MALCAVWESFLLLNAIHTSDMYPWSSITSQRQVHSEFCCGLLKWRETPLSFSSEFIKVTGYSTFVLLRNLLKENKPGFGGESGGGYKGATNPRIG